MQENWTVAVDVHPSNSTPLFSVNCSKIVEPNNFSKLKGKTIYCVCAST